MEDICQQNNFNPPSYSYKEHETPSSEKRWSVRAFLSAPGKYWQAESEIYSNKMRARQDAARRLFNAYHEDLMIHSKKSAPSAVKELSISPKKMKSALLKANL